MKFWSFSNVYFCIHKKNTFRTKQIHIRFIGHGIGEMNFPDIMARLAKMQDRWSKQ